MGKSQLARVLYEGHSGPKRWMNLRATGAPVADHVDRQLLAWHYAFSGDDRLSGAFSSGLVGPRRLALAVVEALNRDGLLVLDDLPDVSLDQGLLRRLQGIAEAFRAAPSAVLSTSQHPLPVALREVLGDAYTEVIVPALSADEIGEVLAQAGAPDSVRTPDVLTILEVITHGHPMLVTAVARWLTQHGWTFDAERMRSLFAGEPLQVERAEARRTLWRVVEDVDTRHLVDRLSLLEESFDGPMLEAVAATHPAVTRARERLDAVLGPFVLPAAGGRFEVSPLLHRVGADYLTSQIRQRVHAAIGRAYLARPRVAANEALRACVHLHQAEDWPVLAQALMSLGFSIQSAEQARAVSWFTSFFAPGTAWPVAIQPAIRIFIRALQVRVLLLRGHPDETYEADLERLIAQGGTALGVPEAVLAARFYTGLTIDTVPARTASLRGVQVARAIRDVDVEHRPDLGVPPETMVWAGVARLRRLEQIKEVVSVLRTLTSSELEAALAAPAGREMAMFLPDSAYGLEADKPEAARDWQAVLHILNEIEELGGGPGIEPLRASAVRARAIVFADYLNRVDDALEMLRRGEESAADAWSRFLLRFTRASILLSKGRYPDAADLFRAVVEDPIGEEFLSSIPMRSRGGCRQRRG